jgi:hypothetical protein
VCLWIVALWSAAAGNATAVVHASAAAMMSLRSSISVFPRSPHPADVGSCFGMAALASS